MWRWVGGRLVDRSSAVVRRAGRRSNAPVAGQPGYGSRRNPDPPPERPPASARAHRHCGKGRPLEPAQPASRCQRSRTVRHIRGSTEPERGADCPGEPARADSREARRRLIVSAEETAIRGRIRARNRLPRDVFVLGLIAFCVAVGFGVLVPVLPVFARSFGVGNLAGRRSDLGLRADAAGVQPVLRPADRALRASGPCWRPGIFIVAVSSGLAGIAQSYAQLLVLRGVGGIGSAMFTVSAFDACCWARSRPGCGDARRASSRADS